MRNIKVILEYDGTGFGGWQRQKNAVTIQQCVEESILAITGEKVQTIGCSRTDAGVHARGFVCNFYSSCNIQDSKIKDALNSKLPSDIRVLQSQEVSEEFHARYNSKGKTYSYTILNRDSAPAMFRNYVYHIKQPLSIEKIEQGANYFIGTQDFSAFRNLGSSVKTTVRTISRMKVLKDEEYIRIYGTADGFLYNMMRIIVGTLVEVGLGKLKPEDIKTIIESKDRTRAGKSAPAHGLCLEEVYY